MWNRTLPFVLIIGCAATAVRAGAVLTYSSNKHRVGNTIFYDFGDPDPSIHVAVAVQDAFGDGIPGGGLSMINFAGFGESAPDGVSISDFRWTFPDWENPDIWFVANLPDPSAAAFASPLPVPNGGSVELAQFTITLAHGHPVGLFSLTLGDPNSIFGDGEYELLPLADDSHILQIAFPEPGTALILVSVFLCGRRRRILAKDV